MKPVLALVCLAATTAIAQSDRALSQKLDAIAGAGVAENRAVGITAAVARGKETLLLKAYGKSDVEGDVAMTADTVLPIGSVTKQFTAVAILQLRDQGKLGLDDEITKWLPDFDTRGSKVTLRNLLNHTAGVQELGQMQELRAMQMMRNPNVTRDEVYKVIRGYPLQYAPGTMQLYSNTHYWLLGLVVEKASGVTYKEYIDKRIFEPLGMSHSMYGNAPNAFGYGMRGGAARRAQAIVQTGTHSAGALCSTAGDMVKWLQALHGGKVLSPRSYKDLITPATLNDGTETRYAMGTTVAEDSHGLRYLGHNGGGFGFSSEARWYPGAQLAIVVLTNSEPDEITKVTEDIAATVLPAPKPAGAFKGDATQLAGKYKGLGVSGEMVIDVTVAPQGIAVSVNGGATEPLPSWVEGWTFRRRDALLIFRRTGASGPATELHFDTGGDHFILKRQ